LTNVEKAIVMFKSGEVEKRSFRSSIQGLCLLLYLGKSKEESCQEDLATSVGWAE